MDPKPRWIQRWETQRAGGRQRYLLQTGSGFGIAMLVGTTYIASRTAHLTALSIVIRAIVWAAGGALFAVLMWRSSEWRYEKYLKSHADRNQ